MGQPLRWASRTAWAPGDPCRISGEQSDDACGVLRPAIPSAVHSPVLAGFAVPPFPLPTPLKCFCRFVGIAKRLTASEFAPMHNSSDVVCSAGVRAWREQNKLLFGAIRVEDENVESEGTSLEDSK